MGLLRRIFSWFTRIPAILGALCCALLFISPMWGDPPRNLIVGCDANYPPYEYQDPQGQPAGFNVELMRELAKEAGLSIEIRIGPFQRIRDNFESGRIDVLAGWGLNEERAKKYLFTVPHSVIQWSLFVRKGSPQIHSEADLAGLTILGQKGDLNFDYLASKKYNMVGVLSPEEALGELVAGRGDCAIINRGVGLYILHHQGIQGIKRLGDINFPTLKYCIALHKGEEDLLGRINEALFVLKESGKFQTIYERHFTVLEQGELPIWVVIKRTLVFLIPLVLILLTIFSWSWSLKGQVQKRTLALNHELAERKKVEESLQFSRDIYAALNQVNQAIVQCDSKGELFREITRICVEFGHFELAWIGEPDEVGERILVSAAHGPSVEYLHGIEISTSEDHETGRGPTGTCFREARAVLAQDWGSDPSVGAWRSKGLTVGFRSNAAFPIPFEGRLIATLTLYSKEPYFFFPDRVQLLDEMSRNLGHALEGLATEELRVRAEDALRESNDLLSLFIHHSPIHAYIKKVTSTHSCVLQASDNFQQMIGIPGSEMVGKTMEELYPAETAKKYNADDWAVVSAGKVLEFAEEFNGRSYTTVKFPIVQGEKTLLAGFTIDITERKQAEETLHRSEERLRKAQQVAHVGSWIWNIKADRLEWSDEMYHIFGIEKDLFQGVLAEVVAQAIHPDDRAAVEQSNLSVTKQGTPVPLEYRIIWPDGTVRVVWAEAGEITFDEAGEPAILTGIVLDITERRHAEEERRKLEKRMSQGQKLEALGVLVAGVAHNINNVLGVIMGTASLREQRVPDPADREAYQSIGKACRRGREVVKSLVHFAQPTLSTQDPFELNALLKEVCLLLENTTRNRVQVIESLAEEPLWMLGDAGSINHALMNLCINSLDAMATVGTLTLRTAILEDNKVEVSVEDNGEGIPPEVLAHVMDPFYTTKEVGKGTGLGLSMTYGAVKAHGGTIEISSQPGQGTVVRLRFPRIPAPTQVDAISPPAPSLASKKVFLVDDEEDVRFLMARMLKQAGVHQVKTFPGGAEVLKDLQSKELPDLIILDQNMPRMTGVQVMAAVQDLYPDLPILISSGQPDIEAWDILKQPNVGVISKPFSVNEIQAKLAELQAHDLTGGNAP